MSEARSLIDDLVERFPRLFHGRPPQTWSDLPPGWLGLAVELFTDLDRLLDDRSAEQFEVLQIKEKFAGLRIYWRLDAQETNVLDSIGAESTRRVDIEPRRPTATFDLIKARINEAAVRASKTCQVCGAPGGSGQSEGRLQTLCGACRNAPREVRC